MRYKALRGRFPLLTLVLAVLALALLALACEEEEEEATPTPPVAETPTEAVTPTPTAPKPGDAGIPSNPREVRGLEGILTLDDGLAMFSERPADEDRTGVTADTIKLGRTAGITGWLAAYEPFWGQILEVMIERVNEAGGIHGRKIELITRDDKGDPSVGVQVTTELVEGENIFAMFFPIGAPTHSAVHDYHVAERVPWLFYFDASNTGQEPVTSKWDFAGQNSDFIGGLSMAEGLYNLDPDAKVAVVYASDHPASIAGFEGIEFGAEKVGLNIVGVFGHALGQPDMTPQAYQVDESGADWLLYHGSITEEISLVKALRETVGWKGETFGWGWVPIDPNVDKLFDGTYRVTFSNSEAAHPENPAWAKLQALADEEGIAYYSSLAAHSLMQVEHLVRALELAGPDLTREGLIEALETGFDGTWQCTVCLGPTVFGPQDHWQNEVWEHTRWHDAERRFEVLGTIDHETSKGLGQRGNVPGLECQPPSAEFPEGTCPWKEES